MRKWYKYSLDPGLSRRTFAGIDQQYIDHAKAMGGYGADEAYRSKEDFFNKYFAGYHLGRLQCYDDFIRRHLNRQDSVLSIASGRCVNELLLMDGGYNLTCSDLDISPELYRSTLSLFPDFKFIKLNILENPAHEEYGVVLCFSLIYLFDDNKLDTFFQNVSKSLKAGGKLILDSAGSPDNALSYLIHDIILKWETYLLWAKRLLVAGAREGIIMQHFGFRRKDEEIIAVAQKAGLIYKEKKNYAWLTDFKRSYFLNKLIEGNKIFERILNIIGRRIPYIRMFCFEKR
ncbi:MAG: class I SAM-dependent methyltransferase [Nitrospirae bacterium]|nr:class I SAM-dependent methyltransferase [Nitrospirota bacterium]